MRWIEVASSGPMRVCVLLKGLGLGRVKLGGVRVPQDDTDCVSRGRPLVRVELNMCRPVRGESASHWGASGQLGLGRRRREWCWFHRTILSLHSLAVRSFALNRICVVRPEESLRVIEVLGVRAG